MFCSKCGTEINDGAVFCSSCGTRQKNKPETAASASNASVVYAPPKSAAKPVSANKRVYKPHPNAYIHHRRSKPDLEEIPHNGSVGFIEAVKLFFVNYINFSGRASKSEYLWAYLFQALSFVTIALIMLIPLIGFIIGGIMLLILAVPSISVTVRRLHDVGKPATWYLLNLVPFGWIAVLVFCCRESGGDNGWGKGPAAVGNYGNNSYSSVNIATAQRVMSDNDIFVIVQNHEPFDLDTLAAKKYLDGTLVKIVPDYTGKESIAELIQSSDLQDIFNSISVVDTDSLVVIIKALGYYIGEGENEEILGLVQQEAVSVLKTRF